MGLKPLQSRLPTAFGFTPGALRAAAGTDPVTVAAPPSTRAKAPTTAPLRENSSRTLLIGLPFGTHDCGTRNRNSCQEIGARGAHVIIPADSNGATPCHRCRSHAKRFIEPASSSRFPPIPAEGFGLGDHPLHPLRPADFHPPRELRSQQGLTRPAGPAPHVTSGCVRAQLP